MVNSFMISFAVTVVMLLVLRPVARKIGLLDCPGGRKTHDGSIPLIGGLAVYVGFLMSAFLFVDLLPEYRGLLSAGLLMLIVGVLDDFHELTAKPRFAAQIMAALLIMFFGGQFITSLGAIISPEALHLGWLAVPFTIFAAVGVINSLNMIDGIDGLAGSVAIVVLLMFLLVVAISPEANHLAILLAVIGGVAGFLLFNLPLGWNARFKVFLGDAGSMFLGLVLMWCCIEFTQGAEALIAPTTALWFMAYPLMDTVSIMIRRLLKGRSPFSPDRDHLHHILLHAGLSVRKSLVLIVFMNLVFGAIGLVGHYFDIQHSYMFIGFLLLFSAYFYVMLHAWRFMKLIRKYLVPHLRDQELPERSH